MSERCLARSALFIILAALLVAAAACSSPEQKYEKHIDRAQARYKNGDFTAARIELLNAIEAKPSYSEAYHLMAQTLVRLQAYQEAIGAYENAVELDPDNQALLLDYVNFLVAGKGYDRAVVLLKQALEKNPGDAVLISQLSRVLASNGKTAEALEAARQLTENQPDEPGNWLNLVYVSLMARNVDGARDALERARKIGPQGDPAVVLAEVELLLGTGQASIAAEKLQVLVEQHPENSDLSLKLGQIREMTGDLDGAVLVYEGILEKEEKAVVRNRLGFLFQRQGRSKEAIAQWEKAIEVNPYTVEPRLNIAKVRLEEGEEEAAWDLVEEALKIQPGNKKALALRGGMFLGRENFAQAVQDLEKAVSGEKNAVWYLALGKARLGEGDSASARAAFEKVLEIDPENPRAQLALAEILSKEGRYEESSAHAEKVIQEEGLAARAFEILGGNALASGDLARAAEYYERASHLDSKNPRLRVRLAAVLYRQGKTEKSITVLKSLLEDRPEDLVSLSAYVGILARAGRFPEAVQAARAHFCKDSPGHSLLLAETLARASRIDEAEAAFKSVIETYPDYGQGYYRMVAFYFREKRLKEAGVWLEKALQQGKKENRYGLNFLLGVLQEAEGDPEAARMSYRAALKENPEFVPAMNNLAWSLAEEGNLDEALRISTRGRKIDQDDPYLADTHAWILHRSGDSTGALPILREASESLPENRTVRLHLVEVLRSVGRTDEAREQMDMLEKTQ